MKARIINSNYEVDVQPYYQEGWLMGFTETSNPGLVIYRPQDLEFQDDKEVGSKPDWSAFRREAAKEILAGMMAHQRIAYGSNYEILAKYAISYADELVKQLKEGQA